MLGSEWLKGTPHNRHIRKYTAEICRTNAKIKTISQDIIVIGNEKIREHSKIEINL